MHYFQNNIMFAEYGRRAHYIKTSTTEEGMGLEQACVSKSPEKLVYLKRIDAVGKSNTAVR